MNWIGLAGIGALTGLIVSVWSQIKNFFSTISGFVIVSYELPYNFRPDVKSYLLTHYHQLPVRSYRIHNHLTKLKSTRNMTPVLLTGPDRLSSIVYWKGLTFCILTESVLTVPRWFDLNAFAEGICTTRASYITNPNRYFHRDRFGSLELGDNHQQRRKDGIADSESPGTSEFDPDLDRLELALKYRILQPLTTTIEDIDFSMGFEKRYSEYLAFPEKILKIKHEVELWKNNRDYYTKRGIPWKRGLLLYGQPGCGKSAFIRSLAEDLDIPVFSFHLITFNNQDMMKYWTQLADHTPCIALFEDIDSVFDGRENRNKNTFQSVLSFDTFLNCIDGVHKVDGVLTIVTTNNIDKVDAAIGTVRKDQNGCSSTRPGRIDRTVHFDILDEASRRSIAQRILKDDPTCWDEFVQRGDGDTGAQFTERCLQKALELLDLKLFKAPR